jgi:hypothetical protein
VARGVPTAPGHENTEDAGDDVAGEPQGRESHVVKKVVAAIPDDACGDSGR